MIIVNHDRSDSTSEMTDLAAYGRVKDGRSILHRK